MSIKNLSLRRPDHRFSTRSLGKRQFALRPVSRAEIEREDRMYGYAARDLTATMMGDPPVGFSFLDKMRDKKCI